MNRRDAQSGAVPTPSAPVATTRRRERRARRPRARSIALTVLGVAVATFVFAWWRTAQAALDGEAGKSDLLAAERHLGDRHLRLARADLTSAARHFRHLRAAIDGLGSVRWLALATPLLRVQVRGTEAFAEAGETLTRSGLHLVDASSKVIDPVDKHVPLSSAVAELRRIDTTLKAGLISLDQADKRVGNLNGYRLLGPINGARNQLVAQLPRVARRAVAAEQGVRALIAFAGGSGARQYLVLSQNPDEVRPTGGFIGTYGVLSSKGHLTLDRYDAIENWYQPRPQAAVPADQAGSAFQFSTPPAPQTIANVNNLPDWPTCVVHPRW